MNLRRRALKTEFIYNKAAHPCVNLERAMSVHADTKKNKIAFVHELLITVLRPLLLFFTGTSDTYDFAALTTQRTAHIRQNANMAL